LELLGIGGRERVGNSFPKANSIVGKILGIDE
jgi:hypothetical protein